MSSKKDAIRQKLAAAREGLSGVVKALTDAQWETAVYSEGSDWTVADLFRHVVDAERGMVGLINQIRQGGEGVPADFDLARWNARAVSKSKEKTPAMLIGDMEQNRANLLQMIETLTDEDWGKQGRHGSLQILSIEQICHVVADHEQTHAQDIKRATGM